MLFRSQILLLPHCMIVLIEVACFVVASFRPRTFSYRRLMQRSQCKKNYYGCIVAPTQLNNDAKGLGHSQEQMNSLLHPGPLDWKQSIFQHSLDRIHDKRKLLREYSRSPSLIISPCDGVVFTLSTHPLLYHSCTCLRNVH